MINRKKFKYNGDKALHYQEWEAIDVCKSISSDEDVIVLAPFIGDKENEMFIYPFGHIVVSEKEFYDDFLKINEDGTLESQVGEYERIKESIKKIESAITDEVIDNFIEKLEREE